MRERVAFLSYDTGGVTICSIVWLRKYLPGSEPIVIRQNITLCSVAVQSQTWKTLSEYCSNKGQAEAALRELKMLSSRLESMDDDTRFVSEVAAAGLDCLRAFSAAPGKALPGAQLSLPSQQH